MNIKKITLLISLVSFLLLTISCSVKQNYKSSVQIGIPSVVNTLNPMYAINLQEGQILERMFVGLLGFEWDSKSKNLNYFQMLAKSCSWNEDSTSLKIKLRDNLFWSDSIAITTDDIIYSFDIHSDSKCQSRFYGTFKDFYTNDDLSIDLEKTFKKISASEFEINFETKKSQNIYYLDLPILPEHVFSKIERNEIPNSDLNFNPICSGPFKLKTYNRNQVVVLEKNDLSFLADQTKLKELVFRIVPNYNSVLLQLKSGELDFYEEIKPEDADEFKNFDNLSVGIVEGRAYDFIGWNNIKVGVEGESIVHPLFGDKEVRRALSLAIDNETIVKQFLGEYGKIAVSPVSDIFGYDEVESEIFNKEKAVKILKEAGWKDSDHDGIINKDGIKFEFDLSYPSGYLLRKHVAEIVKNNLKAIGINAKIKSIEPSVFFDEMFQQKLDAVIAGWSVPIPFEITPYWHSNPDLGWGNTVGYNNLKVDELGEKLSKTKNDKEKKEIVNSFNKEMIVNPPVTFLYWQNSIVVYNNRIRNVKIDPFGALQQVWKWEITE